MAASVDLGKRAFLRARSQSPHAHPATPPWARAYDEFIARCTRCDDCIAACPERILRRGEGGFPTIDFSRGGCTFCGACVERCASGALSREVDPPWRRVAHIAEGCLAHSGVYCQSCRDACAARAIEFPLRAGAPVPQPRIDAARCTGCGACVSVCPSAAIDVSEPA